MRSSGIQCRSTATEASETQMSECRQIIESDSFHSFIHSVQLVITVFTLHIYLMITYLARENEEQDA